MESLTEQVSYQYQAALLQPRFGEEWTPRVELESRHLISAARLKALVPQLLQIRQTIAQERDVPQAPAEHGPFDPGFIELPERLLIEYRRNADQSELGRIQAKAKHLRDQAGRVVILGIGGSYMGARALFEALCSSYHNELPSDARLGVPRVYFEGNNVDNDALQDLLELLQSVCVDPKLREERWGVIAISKSGKTLETAAALRIFRKEAAEFFGSKSPWIRQLFVPVTGPVESGIRALFKAEGYSDADIFSIPDRVGGRFSVFSAAGLLPAATMGLDVRAILLGASQMTKRFLEEPFERNPVLQYAGVNFLMTQELDKPIRVLSVWSKKLEALGLWYDQLLAESLGKQGQGATPLTAVQTRDLHSRAQQHQEGRRDKMINNLIVKTPRKGPLAISMADRNEDSLNEFNRKTYPELMDAALRSTNEAYAEVARPTADLVLPSLNELTLGQLMQMLMLATVVEGKLMGINPYGQPGVEAYKRKMVQILRNSSPAPRVPVYGAPARPVVNSIK